MSALTLSAPQSRTRRPTPSGQHTSQPRRAVAPSSRGASANRRDALRLRGCGIDGSGSADVLTTARAQALRTPAPSPASSIRVMRPVTSTRPTAPARLTRRGRLVMVTLLTLLLFVGLGALSRVVATATSDASSGPVTRTWVVQPGESLWDVAVAVDPDTDPRETIARIVDLNDLPQSAVTVGQSLQVPAR